MTQKEIAQAAFSWRKEDEDNRAVIAILVNNKGNVTVVTGIKSLEMYVHALGRLFKNSVASRLAARIALEHVRKEEDNEK